MYTYGQEFDRVEACAADRRHVVRWLPMRTLDDVDAPAMSDLELYLFFSLLFSAGAETTRKRGRWWAVDNWPTIRSNCRRCVRI